MPVWWRGRAELFGEDAQNCLAAGVPPFLLVTKISSPSKITTVSSHSLSKLWGDIQTFVAVLRIILQRPAVYPLGWQAQRRRIAAGEGNGGNPIFSVCFGSRTGRIHKIHWTWRVQTVLFAIVYHIFGRRDYFAPKSAILYFPTCFTIYIYGIEQIFVFLYIMC